jgi:cytochrome c oxidase subunit 2
MVVLMITKLLLVAMLFASGPPTYAKTTVGKQDPSAKPQAPRVIRVSAERFAYSPSEIVVEKGTVIEFHLTSEDTDHGFRIIGTDVDAQIPKRRRGETVVKYTADTAGRFIIECSRPCGAGHTAMRATLVVK